MQAVAKNPYDLIDVFLFDLDGTLIDTLPSLKEVYFSFLKDFGVAGSEEDFQSCNGLRLREVVERLKSTHSLPGTADDLYVSYKKRLEVAEATPKSLTHGSRELIDYLLSIGVRCGVVTSSTEAYARKILKHHEIEQMFSIVVGSDSVAQGKPNPEPYLKAVEKLNTKAERVLVVEDSPLGISAGVRARIKCIGISPQSETHKTLFAAGAFEVVSSMNQIRPILDRFCHVRPTLYSASDLNIIEDNTLRKRNVPDLDKKVDLYWNALKEAHEYLFDGAAIFLQSTEKSQKHLTIYVGNCPYRYIVAGCRGMVTGIEGLAVTGIVVTDEAEVDRRRYLIGKRSTDVLQYPGCWEFIPSGAIDKDARREGVLDPEEQLIRELKEEVSLDREFISKIEFLGLIRDINYKVADLSYLIKVNPSIIASLSLSSAEYTVIKAVDYPELQAMLQDPAVERVPTTQVLFSWSNDRLSR